MAEYIVSADGYDDEHYETYEEALKVYEVFKDDVMAEGHDIGATITLYKVEPVKRSVSVIDEERMKIGTPEENGHDFTHWAKWDEQTFE